MKFGKTQRTKTWRSALFIYILWHHNLLAFSTRWFSICSFFLRDSENAILYWLQTTSTVAPRYNEDPVITNIWARQNYSKTCGNKPRYNEIPVLTNWFWRSQRPIYPAITNILSCRSQSVKETRWYKWLISQTRLLLVKIGKLWPSELCFI